ncbi:type II toxin-antitoxin system prevent-host-death family antitoxin [soil metagenome]
MLVNIHEAKTHFSKLINDVLSGQEVIIARGGKPVIKLVPYAEETKTRKGGQFRDLIHISEDFDAPLPDDLLNLFGNDKT